MKILSERLRSLRESAKLSQSKMGEIVGVKQSSLNRYEQDQTSPSYDILIRYADYFDISLDYLLGRTDKPQGKLYGCKPQFLDNDSELEEFVEMCFDPKSPMNSRLKETLLTMLREEKK